VVKAELKTLPEMASDQWAGMGSHAAPPATGLLEARVLPTRMTGSRILLAMEPMATRTLEMMPRAMELLASLLMTAMALLAFLLMTAMALVAARVPVQT